MGCQQSITVKETSEKSTITNSSRKPIAQARKKGIGATERLIGSYLEKSGIELPPDPKIDENGHLFQEEVVKRTKSSVSVSNVVLGHVDKGTTVTASYAYWTQRGYYPDDPHKENQDECTITLKFAGEEGDALFAVYDGHGGEGHDCARFAKKKLPAILAKHLRQKRVKMYQNDLRASGMSLKGSYKPEAWSKLSIQDYEATCKKSFVECNKAMHDDPSVKCKLSGTTAVAVAFHMGRITVCNVGDSRAILGHRVKGEQPFRGAGEEEKTEVTSISGISQASTQDGFVIPISLTKDQTPYRKDERERIKRAGGVCMTVDQMEGIESMHENWAGLDQDVVDSSGDPPRVWEKGKEYPGCAFTRSLGDEVGDACGVIAEPEVLTTELTSNDEYLVIGSDGVFEFLTNQNVIDLCVTSRDPLEACEMIVRASYEQWLQYERRTDDITVIVIYLKCNNNFYHKDVIGTTESLVGKERRDDFKPVRKSRHGRDIGGSIALKGRDIEAILDALHAEANGVRS